MRSGEHYAPKHIFKGEGENKWEKATGELKERQKQTTDVGQKYHKML